MSFIFKKRISLCQIISTFPLALLESVKQVSYHCFHQVLKFTLVKALNRAMLTLYNAANGGRRQTVIWDRRENKWQAAADMQSRVEKWGRNCMIIIGADHSYQSCSCTWRACDILKVLFILTLHWIKKPSLK